MTILLILFSLLCVWIVVLVLRAVCFRPVRRGEIPVPQLDVNEQKIAADLAELVRCRTVSYHDKTKEEAGEFERFPQLLQKLFPHLHQACSFSQIGDTGLLYVLKGRKDGAPVVLMAHYDVVPAEAEHWAKPPFSAVLEDGILWGRGTLDTKGTLCAMFEAAEQLITDGFVPEHDIWMALCGDEETTGKSCASMVEELERRGVKPAMVLDEGGAIVENVFPGVRKPAALIGIAEKGRVNVQLTMHTAGGHASTPPSTVSTVLLAKAIVSLSKHPFRQQKTPAVDAMLLTLGRESGFAMKLIFANLWCFRPLFYLICARAGGELAAMTRTTCAPTKLSASKEYNVLPPEVSAGYNLRLLGSDTVESAKAYIEKVVDNEALQVEVFDGVNPSPCSDISGPEYKLLSEVIHESWPGAVVSPYLMMACSDSRHYCALTDKVYRFSAMPLTKAERGMIHGVDERIPVATLSQTTGFYIRLMKRL